MIVKRKDLVRLWQLIEHHRQIKHNVKVSYFLAKNHKRLQPEIEALEEAIKTSKNYRQYDIERARIAKFYADKNENGEPIIQNSSYVITQKLDDFNSKLNLLKQRYKEEIEKREKQLQEYSNLLQEEIEFDGHKIKLEELPNEIEPIFIESLMNIDLLIEPN
jgi:hypothetical protein